MSLMYSNEELMALWDVKQAFDPECILNPGKVFPKAESDEAGPFAGYIHSRAAQAAASNGQPTIADTFTPATVEEAAQGLQAIAQAGKQVSIGNSAQKQGVRVSTSALMGVKTYAPDDLYVIAGAGTPLAELQEFLAKDNKQVSLVSPWAGATLGGIIAANVNAPLRMRYGAIRDLVLSATVAFPDGRVLRTGRPIVKNVAGYDLTKAFVGSYGTLGLIGDVTLKINARPRSKRTLLFPISDIRHGLIWARKALLLALTASAIVLYKGYRGSSDYQLAYSAEGLPQDVAAELEQVRCVLKQAGASDPEEVEDFTGTSIWAEMLGQRADDTLLVRAGVAARDLPAYLQDQAAPLNRGSFIADLSSGLVYAIKQVAETSVARDWLAALRGPALEREGYAVVMDAPASLQELDRWGYRPEGAEVMRALKARWDPRGVMNPTMALM